MAFYEDEVNTAATASANFLHKFKQPGHQVNIMLNYTFHREDEKYFLTNILPSYTGRDTFMLLADEHVTDLAIDYIRPLKQGRVEGSVKVRKRAIPNDMRFFPGINSPLDTQAAGYARYNEWIPALYGSYVYESRKMEVEAGLRVEYVKLNYDVNPGHNTYESDGYTYTQPFPNIRLTYKATSRSQVSLFFNRRVDRPDEVDIRIFPKYDDPEVLKVGNPALEPQFSTRAELGYKFGFDRGSFYGAAYFRTTTNTITRIGTIVPNSTIIYSIFQNAGNSRGAGVELIYQQQAGNRFSWNVNANIYRNTISAFTVQNRYPIPTTFSAAKQTATSGNLKVNAVWHGPGQTDLQATVIYQAPDVIPQGKIYSRFSFDAGIKKVVQDGKGELFVNGTDILNTLRLKKEIRGDGFHLASTDYYETQVFRAGYSYKF